MLGRERNEPGIELALNDPRSFRFSDLHPVVSSLSQPSSGILGDPLPCFVFGQEPTYLLGRPLSPIHEHEPSEPSRRSRASMVSLLLVSVIVPLCSGSLRLAKISGETPRSARAKPRGYIQSLGSSGMTAHRWGWSEAGLVRSEKRRKHARLEPAWFGTSIDEIAKVDGLSRRRPRVRVRHSRHFFQALSTLAPAAIRYCGSCIP